MLPGHSNQATDRGLHKLMAAGKEYSRRNAFGRRLRSKLAPYAILVASLFLGLPLILGPAGRAAAAGVLRDPIVDLKSHQLDNGLRVFTLEDRRTPVVSLQIWVRVGSRDESRYTGLAHLFEHMMFKGSEHLGPEKHAQLIQARGGRINAYTTRDFTVYHEDVTAESLPLVIDLEAERFANLDISEDTLQSEREVVLEERRLKYEDRPGGVASEALAALAFIAHPYRWPVIGWRSDVAAVTVEACREFFDTYYAPNNLILVVVGNFDTDETIAQIERAFGAMQPSAVVPRNPTLEPEQRGERRAQIEFDLQSPRLYATWHAPPTGHSDSIALDVASQILSGGRSSRLYRSLVYDAEVASSANTHYIEHLSAGLFHAMASVRPGESIDRVEELLFGEIDRMSAEGVSEAEVEKAKRQLEVSLVRSLGTTHALASRIGLEMTLFGKMRSLESRFEEIRDVTREDVQRVMQTYLLDSKRSVVRVEPPEAPGSNPSN